MLLSLPDEDFLELFFSDLLLLSLSFLLLVFLEDFLEEEDSSEEEVEVEEEEEEESVVVVEVVLALALMREDTVGYCTKALKGLESALVWRRRARAERSTPKTRAERSTKPGLLEAVTPVTPWPIPCCMRERLRRIGEEPDMDPSAPTGPAVSSRAMEWAALELARLPLCLSEDEDEDGPVTDEGIESMGSGGMSDTTVELSALKV